MTESPIGPRQQLCAAFEKIYKRSPEVFSSAPGRINIIGEHTDYNQGYVLPAAIQLKNYFLASKRQDSKVFVWADNFGESDSFSLQNLFVTGKFKWMNYVKGIFWVLKKQGYALQGINGFIWGNIPLEAGLSSSAALEVSVISSLNELFRLNIPSGEMIKISQKAENDFVGVRCGIMDQFISVLGQNNTALFLDCESLSFEHIPLRLQKNNLCLIVCDTRVQRELSLSGYNQRRYEASVAFDFFLKQKGIRSVKDITLRMLKTRRTEMGENLFKRARHVLKENKRVKRAVQALKQDDFTLLGKLLFLSHESLRDDYQVSCPELDLLYESGKEFFGCLGARLTGAGFGGSGFALVKKAKLSDFKKTILARSEAKKFPIPEFHEITVGEGAKAFLLKS